MFQNCTIVGSVENFHWRVCCPTWLLKVWILIFRIGWNMEWMELCSLESPSPKPHFRPWKAIFDHKKSTFDHFEPFSNHQVSSVCHFRLWSSDSQWFKLIQTESKSRIRKPEFPKIKTNMIFHAFISSYCHILWCICQIFVKPLSEADPAPTISQ